MLLSIIVPAYKVEAYIERCIHSLVDQDLSHSLYEIIVIDDGSPDNLSSVVIELQKRYSNLILIQQENQGVSMARNNALDAARGKYVMAVDPDDYVAPNCLKRLVDKAENMALDVLYGVMEIYDVDSRPIWRSDFHGVEDAVVDGIEAYFIIRGPKVRDPDRSVAILYKLEMLRKYHIQYPRNVPYLEDGLFLGKIFTVALKVGFDYGDLYFRTTRRGSATNSDLVYSAEATKGFVLAAKDILRFGDSPALNQCQREFINHLVAKFVSLPLVISLLGKRFRSYIFVVSLLKKEGLGRIQVEGCQYIYRDYARWYNRSAFLFPFYLLRSKVISP
jgi:glycosyltransferase involved in cell wall biosynthesis